MTLRLEEYVSVVQRAMELAERGRGAVSPNPLVGAVLVRDGQVIAEDWHRKFGEGHAERNLLESFNDTVLPDDVLVVTLEPCCFEGKTPACTDIILENGIKKVIIGLLDPNPKVSGKGVEVLRDAGIEVAVLESMLSWKKSGDDGLSTIDQLRWQNRFFFKWIQSKRPWVTVKIAQTLDGRVVPERGKQFWLTSEASRKHVHQKRVEYDAILVGLGTVLADDPRLDTRLAMSNDQDSITGSPRVVILDAALTLPIEKQVVRPGTIICMGKDFLKRDVKQEELEEKGVEIIAVESVDGMLNLQQVLDELGKCGIASVFVEGGAGVWSSFFREQLVDDVMLYTAPKFLGDGVSSLEGVIFDTPLRVEIRDQQVFGDDVYVHGVFK